MSARIVKKKKDWSANPEECYFLFTDGSFRPDVRNFNYVNILGMGAELRNAEGVSLLYYAEEKVLQVSAFPEKNPEIITMENVLDILYEEGVRKIFIKTDMSGMADKISALVKVLASKNSSSKKDFYASNKPIWHSIFEKIEKFDEVIAKHIPRELNTKADFYSRSANDLVNENQKQENLKKAKIEKVFKDFQEKILSLKPIDKKLNGFLSGVGPVSLFPTKLTEVYYFHPELFSKQSLFIKLLDNKEEKTISLKILMHSDVKMLIKPDFFKVTMNYGEHKELALLFMLMNLVTEKSSLRLINPMTVNGSKLNFNYDHSLWSTFDDVADIKNLFNQMRKHFFLGQELTKTLNEALIKNFNEVLRFEENEVFMSVVHKYKKIAPLNLIDCPVLWKKISTWKDGERFPGGWLFMKHKEKEQKVKAVNIVPKSVIKSAPAFSFFDYGLKMKEGLS